MRDSRSSSADSSSIPQERHHETPSEGTHETRSSGTHETRSSGFGAHRKALRDARSSSADSSSIPRELNHETRSEGKHETRFADIDARFPSEDSSSIPHELHHKRNSVTHETRFSGIDSVRNFVTSRVPGSPARSRSSSHSTTNSGSSSLRTIARSVAQSAASMMAVLSFRSGRSGRSNMSSNKSRSETPTSSFGSRSCLTRMLSVSRAMESLRFSAIWQILRRGSRLTSRVIDHKLLRGVCLGSLAAGFGMHFKARDLALSSFTEEESIKLYATSREVKRLDGFVSHSWRGSRTGKVVALLAYNNMTGATCASVVVANVFACLQSKELLPTVEVSATDEAFTYQYFPWCFFSGSFTFFFWFRYWHKIPESFGCTKFYFFDKLCVHQYDEDAKNAGILSFAAYVSNAKAFLLLWEESYFTRLWCTLEIAALVRAHIHGDLPLVFLPLQLASLSCTAWVLVLIVYAMLAANRSLNDLIPAEILVAIVGCFSTILYAHAARQYIRSRNELSLRLSQFKLSEAQCAIDSDRVLVENTVGQWFGSLEEFDEAVHTTLREKVLPAMGNKCHFPLKFVMPIICLILLFYADFIASGFYSVSATHDDAWIQDIFKDCIFVVSLVTCCPVSLHVAVLMAERSTQKWKDMFRTLGVAIAIILYMAPIKFGTDNLCKFPVYVSSLCMILVCLWAAFLFRGSVTFHHKDRPALRRQFGSTNVVDGTLTDVRQADTFQTSFGSPPSRRSSLSSTESESSRTWRSGATFKSGGTSSSKASASSKAAVSERSLVVGKQASAFEQATSEATPKAAESERASGRLQTVLETVDSVQVLQQASTFETISSEAQLLVRDCSAEAASTSGAQLPKRCDRESTRNSVRYQTSALDLDLEEADNLYQYLWMRKVGQEDHQTSFTAWRCRSFAMVKSDGTASLQYMTGNLQKVSMLHASPDIGIIEMAPITMQLPSEADRSEFCKRMEKYDYANRILRPSQNATEYSKMIPDVLYPICITTGAERMVVAARSEIERAWWVQSLRTDLLCSVEDCNADSLQLTEVSRLSQRPCERMKNCQIAGEYTEDEWKSVMGSDEISL